MLYVKVVGPLIGFLVGWLQCWADTDAALAFEDAQVIPPYEETHMGIMWDIFQTYMEHIWQISQTYLGHIWDIVEIYL